VLVQAAPAVAESHYLLDLAAREDLVAAVVGWVDLSAADVEAQLETLARRGKFAGVRAMVADVPAPGWLATAPVRHGLAALAARDLTLDLLVRPGQLDDVRGVIEAFPAARINVNHCARPLIVAREWQPWASRLAAVAAAGPVVCKLSGLIERGGFEWTVDHLRPYVEHVLACFGPERVMFASNWPIINLVGTYGRWWDAVQTVLDGIGAEQAARRAIFHDTAARFYRLSPTTSGTPRT
jgi:L-fuconolactonase